MSGSADWLRGIVEGGGVNCLVELPAGTLHQFGSGAPDSRRIT